MRAVLPGLLLMVSSFTVFSQTEPEHSHKLARSLKFPDVPGYKVMKCDLHMELVEKVKKDFAKDPVLKVYTTESILEHA